MLFQNYKHKNKLEISKYWKYKRRTKDWEGIVNNKEKGRQRNKKEIQRNKKKKDIRKMKETKGMGNRKRKRIWKRKSFVTAGKIWLVDKSCIVSQPLRENKAVTTNRKAQWR